MAGLEDSFAAVLPNTGSYNPFAPYPKMFLGGLMQMSCLWLSFPGIYSPPHEQLNLSFNFCPLHKKAASLTLTKVTLTSHLQNIKWQVRMNPLFRGNYSLMGLRLYSLMNQFNSPGKANRFYFETSTE